MIGTRVSSKQQVIRNSKVTPSSNTTIADHDQRRCESGIYPIRGGCYLGELSQYVPELDAASFKDEQLTRHTDLGFRVASAIRLEGLPIVFNISCGTPVFIQ